MIVVLNENSDYINQSVRLMEPQYVDIYSTIFLI